MANPIEIIRAIYKDPGVLEGMPKRPKTVLTSELLGPINGFIGGEIGGEDLPEAPFMKKIRARFEHKPSWSRKNHANNPAFI